MNKVFYFLFAGLLAAQILLSERPTEISFPLLFHVGMLGAFLLFGFLTIMLNAGHRQRDTLTYVVLAFLAYFFTIGVIISLLSIDRARSGMLLAIIEYPYRISNLLMVLVIPWFIRKEKQLSKLFALMLIMIGLQIIRDMAVGSAGDSESLLMERLWGPEFSSAMFLAALPFAFGGMIVYWGTPRHRILTRAALLIFWAIVLLKLFLTYSRVVWILLVPLDIFAVIYLLRRKSFQKGYSRVKGRKLARLIFALAGAGVIMMTLLIAFNPQVLKVIGEREQKTAMMAGARWAEYQNAAQEWLTSPVWGKGFGYETRFYKAGKVRSQEYVHNFILQFLMSSGIIGLALILALLGTSFWQIGKLLKRAQSRLQTGILLACLLTLVNIVLLCLFHTLLLKQDTYFLLAMVISITIIIRRLQEQERVSPARHSWPSLTPGLVSRAGR